MKNNTKGYLLSVFLVMSLVLVNTASAVEVGVNVNVNASATGTVQSKNKPATTGSTSSPQATLGNATSSSNSSGSQGDANRSAVSLVVRSLLAIADRDGGIGAEVRLVAQEQASTTIQTNESKNEVESDGSVKVFFFGPDYKNLGELRSSIVTTENNITRLEKAAARTTSASVRADLEVQIQALEAEASSTEAFVKENESKFSLLGWFVKIFVK